MCYKHKKQQLRKTVAAKRLKLKSLSSHLSPVSYATIAKGKNNVNVEEDYMSTMTESSKRDSTIETTEFAQKVKTKESMATSNIGSLNDNSSV